MSGNDSSSRRVVIITDDTVERSACADFMGRIGSLGWLPHVLKEGADHGGGAEGWLPILLGKAPHAMRAMKERIFTGHPPGALVALVDSDSDADSPQAVLDEWLALGVTHFLPLRADDRVISLTLEAAAAMVRRLFVEAAPDDEEEMSDGRDRLTGVCGREAARNWLDSRLSLPSSKGEGSEKRIAACLLIGISQYDSINAAYGKEAGDIVLSRVAKRIVRCVLQTLGEHALVARMGGTEYLVAVPDDGEAGIEERAREVARLVLNDVSRPFVAGDRVIRLTARCGIAGTAQDDDASRLLRRASAALADARRSGASDIWFRSGARRGGAGLRDFDRLDADLRLALDRGEIGIVYQPQYDSHDDGIVGVEALARWNHPELGMLDAGTLFAAAERSDYLLPLSAHIQRTALMEAGQWPSVTEGLRLSINVTAADLAQRDFVRQMLDAVLASGFPASRLTVEITESGLIENIDRAAQILHSLKEHEIRVAIDDFGTGYSSLAYLKALHPDYLKIDHSLSSDILGTPRDRVILRAIIGLARSLALTVIAEGVETEEQLRLLADDGCDIYQGFLRSAALSSAELVTLVSEAKADAGDHG